jgi:hypothetical protein
MFVFILVRITRGIVHVVVFTIDYCHMFVFIFVRFTRGIVHVIPRVIRTNINTNM